MSTLYALILAAHCELDYTGLYAETQQFSKNTVPMHINSWHLSLNIKTVPLLLLNSGVEP